MLGLQSSKYFYLVKYKNHTIFINKNTTNLIILGLTQRKLTGQNSENKKVLPDLYYIVFYIFIFIFKLKKK